MAQSGPPVVAFYSFKGGVGRTTTLANIGYLLAEEGQRVFLWDFDLDAPSLQNLVAIMERYEHQTRGGLGLIAPPPEHGFADYLVQWEREDHQLPSALEPFLQSFPVGDQGGQIEFLGAGFNGPEYVTKLAEIHWETFYEVGGYDLLEHLRGQIAVRGPSIILIDARAGLTDPSFAAVLQLADVAVLQFRLDQDGVDGIATANNLFRRRTDPELKLLNVPSMVPSGDLFRDVLAAKARAEARGVPFLKSRLDDGSGEVEDLEIPFEMSLQLIDEVFVQSRTQHPLSREYRKLKNEIWERAQPVY